MYQNIEDHRQEKLIANGWILFKISVNLNSLLFCMYPRGIIVHVFLYAYIAVNSTRIQQIKGIFVRAIKICLLINKYEVSGHVSIQ